MQRLYLRERQLQTVAGDQSPYLVLYRLWGGATSDYAKMAVHDILPSRLLLEGAIISTTHLRAAAGACVLSAGLLIVSGQGAMAVAEPESSSSSGSSAESQ